MSVHSHATRTGLVNVTRDALRPLTPSAAWGAAACGPRLLGRCGRREEGRRAELVKGGTTTSIVSATLDPRPQKPTPTAIAAPTLGEEMAGEEIVALRDRMGSEG